MAPVNLNQTFRTGETATVECDAYRGNPPRPIRWLRNGRSFWNKPRIGFDDNFGTLIIEDINESDAGVYQCRLCTTVFGCIKANITVNVIGPPLEEMINPNLPANLSISFGRPLRLNCRSPEAQPTVCFSWVNLDKEEIASSHLLEVTSDDVTDGIYRCLAYTVSGNLVRHAVRVTVIDLPPLHVDPDSEMTIRAKERREWFYFIDFRSRLDKSNISVQWKVLRKGRMIGFDFGSRFSFYVNKFRLVLYNNHTKIRDNGQYLLNVSNQFGYVEFTVHINVRKLLPREPREVQLQVTGVSSNGA